MRGDTALLTFYWMELNKDVRCSLVAWWGSTMYMPRWKGAVSLTRDIESQGPLSGERGHPLVYIIRLEKN